MKFQAFLVTPHILHIPGERKLKTRKVNHQLSNIQIIWGEKSNHWPRKMEWLVQAVCLKNKNKNKPEI